MPRHEVSHLPAPSEPWRIANDPSLDRSARLARLRELELDVRQALVAAEEGMDGPRRLPSLAEVRAAQRQLGPVSASPVTPTKF